METAVQSPHSTEILYTEKEIQATYRKVTYKILPFLVFCYIFAIIDRSNIGFAKLQFVHDLGFTEAIYGLGAGAFSIGYLLCEIPSNLYMAKRGIRRTMLRIMIVWGLCCAAMALMRTANQFYLFRVLLGAGEAGLFPGILLYLTFWIPAARRARFTALFMCSNPLAGFISGPLSGWIMHSFSGAFGLNGWQWLFLMEGLPACFLGGAAFFYFSDYPSQARWLTDRQKSIIAHDLEQDQQKKSPKSHQSIWQALRYPDLYLLVCMSFALQASTSGMYYWLPTIVRNAGIKDVLYIGLLACIPNIISAVTQLLIAYHSDKKMERRWHAATCVFIAGAGWILMPLFAKSPFISIFLFMMVAIGSFGAMGPFWTIPSALLSGTAAAAGIAFVTSMGVFGMLLSPPLVGWIATRTGSLAGGQVYQGAVLVLAGIAVLMVRGIKKTSAFVANR